MILPARNTYLITRELDGEVLVQNPRTDEVHRLVGDVATVWRFCDGSASVADVAAASGLSEAAVETGVVALESKGLLQVGASRRSVLRASVIGGVAVASLPVIDTVLAPMAAAAATGGTNPGGPGTYSLSTYLAQYAGSTPPNVNAGGNFSFFAAPNASLDDPSTFLPLNTAFSYNDTNTGHVLYGLGYNNSTPEFAYNDENTLFVHNQGSSITSTPAAETFAHPGASDGMAFVFKVPNGYTTASFNATVNHADDHNFGQNLRIRIVQFDSSTSTASTISGPTVLPPGPGTGASLSNSGLPVGAGDGIELIIDDNGIYGYNSASVTFTVTLS